MRSDFDQSENCYIVRGGVGGGGGEGEGEEWTFGFFSWLGGWWGGGDE